MPPIAEYGQTVTLTAAVSPTSASGFVAFMDAGLVIGTGVVSGSGIAKITTLTLSAGQHSLKAVYGGGANAGYLPSQSAAMTYTVTAAHGEGFLPANPYAQGMQPQSIGVADFNGDGKSDLVVIYAWLNPMCVVLLGNGDGTFHQSQAFFLGAGAWAVATGDFNGDGMADLAIVDGGGAGIWLGHGDGTFQKAGYYATGVSFSAAVGDFNADGVEDLVIAGENAVTILLGNGDGTFRTGINYTIGSLLQFVAVGDFDGDGKEDLVVADYGGDNVSVLLGAGEGTFRTPVSYAVGIEPTSVATGDFNRDGISDLAVGGLFGKRHSCQCAARQGRRNVSDSARIHSIQDCRFCGICGGGRFQW